MHEFEFFASYPRAASNIHFFCPSCPLQLIQDLSQDPGMKTVSMTTEDIHMMVPNIFLMTTGEKIRGRIIRGLPIDLTVLS